MIDLLFYFILLLAEDKGTKAAAPTPTPTPTPTNNIGFSLPSFSLGTGGLIYKIIFSLECFLFLTFILLPRFSLSSFQTQVVIFQGILIGVDHVLSSSLMGFGEGFLFYIAVVAAPVCAFLSVNDKFKNLFLSFINAYGTTYLLSLILRLTYLVCIIVGVVLYFIFLFLNLNTFGLVLGKIYAGTLSGIALIDIWGLLSILGSLHGVTTSNTSFAISYLIGFVIFAIISLAVVIPTYFQAWATKKMVEYQTGSGEGQPAV